MHCPRHQRPTLNTCVTQEDLRRAARIASACFQHVSGRPCICPVEAAGRPGCSRGRRRLVISRSPDASCGHPGETNMQRIVILCTALAFGVCASPLAAQQTPPAQQSQPTSPTEPAPPTQQSMPEQTSPPPFPPMPRVRNRWVDVGNHHASHSRSHASHSRSHATRSHERRTHTSHRERHADRAVSHLSKRTIRSCHRMSYKEIMRESDCRTLMSQELAAAQNRHDRAGHRHKGAAHRHTATQRHHHARHRRG